MYGNPPIFEPLNLPEQTRQMENKRGAYMTMFGLSESFKVPVICQIVDLIK